MNCHSKCTHDSVRVACGMEGGGRGGKKEGVLLCSVSEVRDTPLIVESVFEDGLIGHS